MPKQSNKKFSDEELLQEWEEEKGKTPGKEFAKRKGISYKQLDNALYRARKKRKFAEEVEDNIDGNYRVLISKTSRIKTIPELLEACEVDLDEWQVEDHPEVGTWEMGRRAEQKAIIWHDGKIAEGKSFDTGKLWIETLFRLRVTLVRKVPKAVFPVIRPVRYDSVSIKSNSFYEDSGRILVIPDSQMGFRRNFQTGELIPFHDRRAHSIVMKVAQKERFDHVIYLGDGIDFTEWTDKFVGEPEFYHTTRPAILEFAWFLHQMKMAQPEAEHELIPGNHDDRPNQMLRKHLQAAYQLKPSTMIDTEDPYSLDHLLGLKDLGIHLCDDYPNGEVWPSGYVRLVHTDGLSSAPGGTAAKMIRDATATTLAGHNHRLESATKTVDGWEGIQYVTTATCGCLCHIDYRVPGHKKGQNWQQGFAVVHGYNLPSPRVELVPIYEGEATFNGKHWVGDDYSEQLSEETGWKF